jgi:hypothetical protein
MKTDVLDAYVMFSVMLGLCGVVSAATVRMTCSCISSMARYRILCLVCGIIYGFLIYSDAGVLLFLAAVLYCFIISRNNSGVVSGLAFLLPGIIAGFASGLLAFNSLSDIFGSLSGWGQSFFGSGFSFEGIDSIGSDVMLHFVVYIILAVVMFGALSGFHYSGQYSGMTPWLLLMMLICLVSPFMGITLVNSLEMMTTAGICVFSAGLSASVTEDGEDRGILAGTEQAEAQSSESRQEEEVYGSGEIAKARAAARVISPERNITDAVEPECEELVVAAADEKVSSEMVEDAAADSDMSMTKPGNNPELSSEVPL